jgi:hypothetical protein
MVHISGSHGKLRRWQQRSRAGSKETRLMEHVFHSREKTSVLLRAYN